MIDAIERKKAYFDYRFYRQHTSIHKGEFIKVYRLFTIIGPFFDR